MPQMDRLSCLKNMVDDSPTKYLSSDQFDDEEEDMYLITAPADLEIGELHGKSIIMEGAHKIKKTDLRSRLMQTTTLKSVLCHPESQTLLPGPSLKGIISVSRTLRIPPPAERDTASFVHPEPERTMKEDFPPPGSESPKRESKRKRKKTPNKSSKKKRRKQESGELD